MMNEAFKIILNGIGNIWNVMERVFVLEFSSYSISLTDFLVGLIVTGVILSIFLSFVNVDSIRTDFTIAERKRKK